MKKFLAILAAGTMLIGTTANAMVLEDSFSDYRHMTEHNWTGMRGLTDQNNNTTGHIRYEVNVVDGKVVFSGADKYWYTTFGDNMPVLSKTLATTTETPSDEEDGEPTITTTYNDIVSGKTVISFDVGRIGNSWKMDLQGTVNLVFYTGEEESYTKLFTILMGQRAWDMRVNGVAAGRLSGAAGLYIVKENQMNNLSFTIDHDNNTISLDNVKNMEGLGTSSVPNNNPYTFTENDKVDLSTTPITKVDIAYSSQSVEGACMIDNFKIVNTREVESEDGSETVTTTLADEDFENIASLDDVGMSGNSVHYFRTANSIGILNNTKTTNAKLEHDAYNFILEKHIDALPTTGKAVFEYSMKSYKADSTPAIWSSVDSLTIPFFAVGNKTYTTGNANNKSNVTATTVAGYTGHNNGTTSQAQVVSFYGYKSTEDTTTNYDYMNTNVKTGDFGKDVTDMRVVLDLDNHTYNVYYKDASGTYQQFNSIADIPFASTSVDIDTLWFGSYYSTNHKYEISGLTAYTIDASGKQTPVVVKDDAEVNTITAGDKVTVYAPIEGDTEYASLIIAAYNEDGKMVDCKIEEAGAEITGFELLKKAYTMPEGAVTMKAFIWDGVGDLTPYAANAVLTAPVAEVPAE